MILLVHDYNTVVQVTNLEKRLVVVIAENNPSKALFKLAKKYPDELLVWCHKNHINNLNIKEIKQKFYLKNMMMSFSNNQYLPREIGYVEDSPFLKINRDVKYPTWLMSSQVGVIHASQILKFIGFITLNNSLDYTLNSIAKIGISKGLFCYSEPKLLKNIKLELKNFKASNKTLFKFVKQHYKARWVLLLFFNFIWHNQKFPLISLISSFFNKKKNLNINFKTLQIQDIVINNDVTVDVIIPTIGRKEYLLDVLEDLALQTLLPKQVIIVEQNQDTNSKTELDYIQDKEWPFKIVHNFMHQTGACNARNVALSNVVSDYVFLADDDIRIKNNLLQKVINCMLKNKFDAVTLSSIKPEGIETYKNYIQWTTFGSGCSIVKSNVITNVRFNMALEFGYGEDIDFGMKIRNEGTDVFYLFDAILVHLSAPIGGFRTKFKHPWHNEKVQPKPSPTVMLNRINNSTKQQLLGYKTVLFFKFFRDQNNKNPITYYKAFKKQWQLSIYWANKLKNKAS